MQDVLCICVADGKTPKSGHLFAGCTEFKVISIDPLMSKKYVGKSGHKNLTCIDDVVENANLGETEKYKMVVLVGIHSHANIQNLWDKLVKEEKPILCLSIPCCGGFVHGPKQDPEEEFKERGIFSDKNKILIWHKNLSKYDQKIN